MEIHTNTVKPCPAICRRPKSRGREGVEAGNHDRQWWRTHWVKYLSQLVPDKARTQFVLLEFLEEISKDQAVGKDCNGLRERDLVLHSKWPLTG